MIFIKGNSGVYVMYMKRTDYGPDPYAADIAHHSRENSNFRTAIWTGENLQMTLMCIPPCEDIGLEIHPDTDQVIRVEQGCAVVMMGKNQCRHDFQENLSMGDVVFVPAGTWHNIVNVGRCPLKLSSIYAPPKHPRGTVHRTKAEAEMED